MLLERLVYFDNELLQLFSNPELGIEPDMMLNREEFDLAYGMTLVLNPIRIVTKFVQCRDRVTLPYVPGYLDRLVTQLSPGAFAIQLQGRAAGVLAQVEAFQARLVASIRERFADLFQAESLALAGRMLLPGANLFQFTNFDVNEATLAAVRENMLNDLVELLPPDMSLARKNRNRVAAAAALDLARDELDVADEHDDPLVWWPDPAHQNLGALFPLVRMLLAIPASSAEDERAFSSAGVTLSPRRTRLDIDNFRREHRVRQYLASNASLNSQTGRRQRLERANLLLRLFGEMSRAHADAAAQAEAPDVLEEAAAAMDLDA